MGIDANAVAHGAAEQLVNRNAERLAFDVPQGLIDAAQSAGEDGAATIERMAIDGLPVFSNRARILAHQVRFNLFDGFGAGEGAAFGDGFAQADDAGVRMDS